MTLDISPPLTLNTFINEGKRSDGRSCSDGRIPEILFGDDWGECMAILGPTSVSAVVSKEIMRNPSTIDKCDDPLQVNVELSSELAVETNRSQITNAAIECQKYLEKCLSNNFDVETLRIISGAEVFIIKLVVCIYSNEGNLFECASIAAITALLHFKIPNTGVMESMNRYKLLPLPINDIPLIINLAVMEDFVLVDPTKVEERNSDGSLIIATNASQKVYFIQCKRVLLSIEDVLLRYKTIIVKRVTEITQLIKGVVSRNEKKRRKSPEYYANMADSPDFNSFLSNQKLIQREELCTKTFPSSFGKDKLVEIKIVQNSEVSNKEFSKHSQLASKWGIEEEIGSSSEDEDVSEIIIEKTSSKQRLKGYKENIFCMPSLIDFYQQREHRSNQVIHKN